jgi:hypothetical protein
MIITLSRQLGSAGDDIASRVAAALGLSLVGWEHIQAAALAAGVPAELSRKLMYEGHRTFAGTILDSLGGTPAGTASGVTSRQGPLDGIFTPMLPPASISLQEAVQTIGLVVKDIASHGNVLILGQGSQVWLRGYQNTCHVQIVAPFDFRVGRVATREKISLAAASRRVRACDQARADYLARYHGVNWLDPLLYHMVINTGQTPAEVAVALIVQAAQVVGHMASPSWSS